MMEVEFGVIPLTQMYLQNIVIRYTVNPHHLPTAKHGASRQVKDFVSLELETQTLGFIRLNEFHWKPYLTITIKI